MKYEIVAVWSQTCNMLVEADSLEDAELKARDRLQKHLENSDSMEDFADAIANDKCFIRPRVS